METPSTDQIMEDLSAIAKLYGFYDGLEFLKELALSGLENAQYRICTDLDIGLSDLEKCKVILRGEIDAEPGYLKAAKPAAG